MVERGLPKPCQSYTKPSPKFSKYFMFSLPKVSKCYLFFCLFSFVCHWQYAQKMIMLSGTVKNAKDGELLIGATVYSKESKKGTQTDDKGAYTLALPTGKHNLQITFIGYITITQSLDLQANTTLDFVLETNSEELSEVVVTGQSAVEKVEAVQMSTNTITAKEAKLLPALFGETDIIKILQLKPGVQSGGEGTSGLYVRGGGPDQNLVLLDGALVYNPNHLFGFFSVFNNDAIDRVELYKGDFPSQFGGRLSSVVDVKMRSNEAKKFNGTGGIGLISSRLALGFPIYFANKTKKINVLLSGRRTYFDIFTRAINRNNEGVKNYDPIPSYYFHDLTAKVSFDLNPNNTFYFSGYYGRDAFEFSQRFSVNLDWGNATAVVGWLHRFNPKLSVNNAFLYSSYDYLVRNEFDNFKIQLGSGITDLSLKSEWSYKATAKHLLSFGGLATSHSFSLAQFSGGNGEDLNVNKGAVIPALAFGLYLSDEWTVNSKLALTAGLRYSGFASHNKFYSGLEPRFSTRYKLTDKIAIKASAAQMYQYQHLVSSSGASLPSDLWYPSNAIVKPEQATQVAAGISFALFGNQFFLSNEIYYKTMTNQIDFKDGAQLVGTSDLDNEFVFGKGWAYGNEIYLEKKTGKTTGWLGFTHAYAWRQFANINRGEAFHPRYDRRNDVSLVVMHKLSKRLTLSATWVYGTGPAVSLPIGRFYVQDIVNRPPLVIPEYTDRNSFRLIDYHRLDLGLVLKFKPKWGESDLTFSIYNLYNRRNAFFLYFEQVTDPKTKLPSGFVAKQVSLFPIIPSITYNFKF
jgi:hypothetical protein